jgi:hypothetical protein
MGTWAWVLHLWLAHYLQERISSLELDLQPQHPARMGSLHTRYNSVYQEYHRLHLYLATGLGPRQVKVIALYRQMAASRLFRHMALHSPGQALVVLIPVLGTCLSRNDTVSIMVMYLTSKD